jgi:RNA polymerase sigma-70 factor (ECF subfamily)
MQHKEQEAASAEQDHSSLREALEQLSGPDRAILSLRYEEQFDVREIANVLGIPEGTVKSRLFHARRRVRKYLEENDG